MAKQSTAALKLYFETGDIPTEAQFADVFDSELRWVAVPASASASGVVGDVAIDGDYIYWCYATNTWLRSAGTTW